MKSGAPRKGSRTDGTSTEEMYRTRYKQERFQKERGCFPGWKVIPYLSHLGVRRQRVWFSSCFSLNKGKDFDCFGLK